MSHPEDSESFTHVTQSAGFDFKSNEKNQKGIVQNLREYFTTYYKGVNESPLNKTYQGDDTPLLWNQVESEEGWHIQVPRLLQDLGQVQDISSGPMNSLSMSQLQAIFTRRNSDNSTDKDVQVRIRLESEHIDSRHTNKNILFGSNCCFDINQVSRSRFIFSEMWESKKGLCLQSLYLNHPYLSFNRRDLFGASLYSSLEPDRVFHRVFNKEHIHERCRVQLPVSSSRASLRRTLSVKHRMSFKHFELHEQGSAYSRVVEKVLDSRSHKLFSHTNISCMVKHPQLPIVFLGCQKGVLVMSCSTFSLISEFSPQDTAEIRDIKCDLSGSKLLLLDKSDNLALLKIDDFGRTIFELCRVQNKKISDAVFLGGGSQVVLLVPEGLLLLSLLTQKLNFLFKFDKASSGVQWNGPKHWTSMIGVPHDVFDEEPSSNQAVIDSSVSKIPSLEYSSVIFDSQTNRLIVYIEDSRQILFFDLKSVHRCSLKADQLKLSKVIFFRSKAKLTTHCVSFDHRFIYIADKKGKIYKVDIQAKKVMGSIQLDLGPGNETKLIGMCKYGNFLLITDKNSRITMVNY